MAGTLTISTLSDGTNSTSSTNCIQGSAKAWVNFNGVTTATVRASYNVSSVTRNSAGNYTVTFTNNMPDANYGFSVAPSRTNASTALSVAYVVDSSPPTASSFSYQISTTGATGVDSVYTAVSIFR